MSVANVSPMRRPSFARGDHAELADVLLRSIAPRRDHLVHDQGELRRYSPMTGIYELLDAEMLRRTVKTFAGCPKGENSFLKITVAAAEGAITFACDEVHQPGFFENARPGIAFVNGFVVVEDGKIALLPHGPENRARHVMTVEYKPDAKHPELDRFHDEVFADASEDERAARTMLLQEFAGACLIGEAPKYQRCLELDGPGGNGKSQEEQIIRAIFPGRTVCSLPPQQWGERFQIAKLVGTLANICDEIPEKEIVSGDTFKSMITGEPIHMERKHRDPFEYRPRAGHIFSANSLPSTADLSHGFFRRFLICKFTRDMESAHGSRKDAAKRVISSDLVGIAAWAIEGAARLQRQDGYTVPPSSDAAVSEWKRASNSVLLFVDEKTGPIDPARPTGNGNGTPAAPLYGAYRTWCVANGYKSVAAKNFAARMRDDAKRAGVRQSDGIYYPVSYRESGANDHATM